MITSINWHINSEKHSRLKDVSFQFKVASNTYWEYLDKVNQKKERFDLVICNPPYLPIPEKFRELRAEQTTAGTDLLEHVIRRSRKLGKITIIQFSHLAQEQAEKAAAENGIKLQPIGRPKLIPFRIRPALENEEYMGWLLDKAADGKDKKWGLIANKDPDSKDRRHGYYHSIQSYFVAP